MTTEWLLSGADLVIRQSNEWITHSEAAGDLHNPLLLLKYP